MGGTKIIIDNVGAIASGGSPYCYGNLFLGSVCSGSILDNTEVTEADLAYVGGIQITVVPQGSYLIPVNYNYQTKQINYFVSKYLGTSYAP